MNSVRPLITITILAVVGGFLYYQINRAPMRPLANSEEEDNRSPAVLTPPLAIPDSGTASSPPPAGTALAPPWAGGSSAAAVAANETARNAPQTPLIPDLPELSTPGTTDADSPLATPSASARSEPTPSDPTSRVADDPLPSFAAAPGETNLTAAPAATASEHDGATESAMAAMGLTPSNGVQDSQRYGSLPPANDMSATPAGRDDRYSRADASAEAAEPAIASNSDAGANGLAPASAGPQGTFAAAWPEIAARLQNGELVQAHLLLSSWFNDPSLTPAETQQVEMLLGQLAGTVIYSTEHRLEPPYTVRAGETLEDIARQHDVPWQLLSKINGIPGASPLRAGQQLKVVRGPFEGELDLRRNQLALKVDGRYAGKFPVSPPSGGNLPPGEWVIQDKPTAPAERASVYGNSAGGQPAIEYSLLLRNASATAPSPGTVIQIGPGTGLNTAQSLPSGVPSTGNSAPVLVKVSSRDAEELADILSIGSRVVIRR